MQQFWWTPWYLWRWSGLVVCIVFAAILVWFVRRLAATGLHQLGYGAAGNGQKQDKFSACLALHTDDSAARRLLVGWWAGVFVLAGLCGWFLGATAAAMAATAFMVVLSILALIDLRLGLLPDSLTLSLLWAGLLVNSADVFVPLQQAVLGAAVGYIVLWLLYWAFFLVTGREGLGYGDFKLSAALGAWLGWQALPSVLLVASISGLAFALWHRVTGRLEAGQSFSFGPWLAVAGAALFLAKIRPYF